LIFSKKLKRNNFDRYTNSQIFLGS